MSNKKESINEMRRPNGKPLLIYAADRGYQEMIKALLTKKGIDCNLTSPLVDWKSALSIAAEKGNLGIVDELLSAKGIIVDLIDRHGRTPLHLATRGGHLEVVKALLCAKADPNLADRLRQSPLHLAAERNFGEILKLLLADKIIMPDEKDSSGETPLSVAVKNGHKAIVAQLTVMREVDHNNVSNAGDTPLLSAVRNGHIDIAKTLLKRWETDVFVRGADGKTALELAEQRGLAAILLSAKLKEKEDPGLQERIKRAKKKASAK